MFLPTPAPDANAFPKRRRKLYWSLALMLGVALVTSAGWYAYQEFRHHRARNLIAEAEGFARSQEWQRAHQHVQAALQIAPNDPRALRLAARLLSQFGREDAFPVWQSAFASSPATVPEVLEVLKLAQVTKRFDVAEHYLKAAFAQKTVAPEIVRASAFICAAKGDIGGAIQLSRTCLESQPGDWEMRLVLAQQLLLVQNADAQKQGRALLADVTNSDHTLAARALVQMAGLADLSTNELQQCVDRLSRYPTNDVLRDLLLQDLKIRQKPEQRSELIAATIRQYQHGTPADLLLLTRWLNEKTEHKKVTQIVPLSAALTNKALFLAYGDALAALGAWTNLASLLSREQLPIEPVLVEIYRGRVARELKQDRQAIEHWAQAQYRAADNPSALQYLAEYAERLGETAEAFKAYRRLTRDPNSARAAYLALIRLAEKRDDTRELRSLLKELVARFPQDPAPRIDLAYLDLLAGENVAAARKVAEELYKKNPQVLAYRTTLALACLRQNEIATAQALYRDLKADGSAISPGWQAIQAAVIGASGEKATANQIAKSIAQDRLRPEERALLQRWL